jgi:hypothetical protein
VNGWRSFAAFGKGGKTYAARQKEFKQGLSAATACDDCGTRLTACWVESSHAKLPSVGEISGALQ